MDYEKLNRERFGRRLATARSEAGLTQKGLAFLTGFVQSEIAVYEKGKRSPRDAAVQLLAEKLNVDVNWLKYGDDSTYTIKETDYGKDITINHFTKNGCDHDALVKKMSALSDDSLSIVNELVDALFLDENPSLLNKAIEQEESTFKNTVHRKRGSNTYNAELDMAACLANLSDIFPDIFASLVKGEITVRDADDQAQEIVYEKWPVIKEKIDTFTALGKSREENRLYVHNEIIPEVRRLVAMDKRKRWKSEKNEKGQ